MNIELLDRIATWLEADAPETEARGMTFNMRPQVLVEPDADLDPDNWCGTACCIAGAAVTFADPGYIARRIYPGADEIFVWDHAVKLLGISHDQARWLFAPFDCDSDAPRAFEITPEMAAATIRHLIQTGEVRW